MHGEGFRLEKLPVGSRVIYAPEPFDAIKDARAAIRHALLQLRSTIGELNSRGTRTGSG
jgi:hypothetical protein